MDEKIKKKIEEIKELLSISNLEDFYDDEEIERLARLPIELSLPIMTKLVVCANAISREYREYEKDEREDKEKFQKENV
jgi:hypothetical protein